MTARLREALAVVAMVAEIRGPDALLFGSIVGGVLRPMDPHNWHRDMWRGVTHRARVNRRGDRLHFHDLRHTYGSRLAGAGVPRSEIATLMGHADESTTAIYIHTGDDGRRLQLVHRRTRPVTSGTARSPSGGPRRSRDAGGRSGDNRKRPGGRAFRGERDEGPRSETRSRAGVPLLTEERSRVRG